jgi:YggT family protein
VLYFAIIARALLSWFSMGPHNPVIKILFDITEPILAPLRSIIPRIGMIDISPIVALLILGLIRAQVLPVIYQSLL